MTLVEVSTPDPGVGYVLLDRPETNNALTPEMMEDLAAALAKLDDDDAIRCIIVHGGDEAFASGADVGAPTHPAAEFWSSVASVRKPMIASVSGFALGAGCELALLCDMIIASETAEFGQPEITLGIIPGGGGTQRLTRLLGKQRAMEMVLTGVRIKADEAYQMGLVNKAYRKKEYMSRTLELASLIARRAPLAVKFAKQAVLTADETGLEEGLAAERRLYEMAMVSEDRVEGMQAFLEKRRPDFKGR